MLAYILEFVELASSVHKLQVHRLNPDRVNICP